MNELEEKKFDVLNIEYDDEGIPFMPRFSYTIPRPFRDAFIKLMLKERRTSISEQLTAIVWEHVERLKKSGTDGESIGPLGGERRQIPSLISKPLHVEPGSDKAHNEHP